MAKADFFGAGCRFVQPQGKQPVSNAKATSKQAVPAKDLQRLRARLPRSYRAAAVKRLQRTHRRTVSPSYISQVIGAARFDEQVIEVLVQLADEHQARVRQLRARMNGRKA